MSYNIINIITYTNLIESYIGLSKDVLIKLMLLFEHSKVVFEKSLIILNIMHLQDESKNINPFKCIVNVIIRYIYNER